MYAEIILCEHINKVEDLNLPQTVPASDEDGNEKATFSEIEVTHVMIMSQLICTHPYVVHTICTI